VTAAAEHPAVALHTGFTPRTSVTEDVRMARAAGFDGIELSIVKLLEEADGIDAIARSLGPLSVTMLDALTSIESSGRAQRAAMRARCERSAELAAALGCRTIQVVALGDFEDTSPDGLRRTLVAALDELSDVAAPHGVRLALEPLSFSPFNDLDSALDVIDRVGRDRVGLVLDTWHLWTTGVSWSAVAAVDPALIACAHIGDGRPRSGPVWSDDDRNALAGDGIVPLAEGVAAIRRTGFTGPWSVELLGDTGALPEPLRDPPALAAELLLRARRVLAAGAN
jgi:sugar phosphate isomerase/epimerase